MLDAFVPDPRLTEVDHVDFASPPSRVYDVVRHLDAGTSPLIAALFSLRRLPERFAGKHEARPTLRLSDLGDGPGFCLLADEPGHEFAVGAIGRFWKPQEPFRIVSPELYAAFDEPGLAKLVWSLRVEPRGEAGTRLFLEVRLTATDDASWHLMNRYFLRVAPFGRFVLRHVAAMLADELGALDEIERVRALPGDELIPHAKAQITHHVDIEATPAAIWPWLVQMGRGRAGLYGHDWLDNGGAPSADEIVPELQRLAVGDVIPLIADLSTGFEVLALERERALVLGALNDLDTLAPLRFDAPEPDRFWRMTWAFALRPLDLQETRLTVRGRVDFASAEGRAHALLEGAVHDFMERAQLRHLKERAEGAAHHERTV